MASANFMKCTSSNIGGLTKHFDQYMRLKLDHSNTDIDKNLCADNYFLGAENFQDMKNKWSNNVAEKDAIHPPLRNDKKRNTAVLVEVPCPWEIVNEGRERDFFEAFYQLLNDTFGADNVHGLVIHHDEVHEYIDDGEKKTSMIHGHGLITPYAKWMDRNGEREGINAKNCINKLMLKKFQTALNDMCIERFGIEYQTHGISRHKTVEELKQISRLNEELSRRKELIQEHNQLIDTIEELKQGSVALAKEIIREYECEER